MANDAINDRCMRDTPKLCCACDAGEAVSPRKRVCDASCGTLHAWHQLLLVDRPLRSRYLLNAQMEQFLIYFPNNDKLFGVKCARNNEQACHRKYG